MKMTLKLTIFLTVAISATRIGMGYFNSISGPTLLYLAQNVDSSVSTVSFMFLGRSIGVIAGSIFAGIFKRRFPKISQLLVLGFSIAFPGVVTMLFPWIRAMWILLLNITIGGIMYGYLDAGLQALILQLWGEVGSRAHIQLFHFTYSVGAFIAPLIVQPFLVMADENKKSASRCPHENENDLSFNVTTTPSYLNTSARIHDDFNPVGWGYKILGAWMFLVSFCTVILACFNVEGKLHSHHSLDKSYKTEVREEESFRDVFWIFLLVVGYYFCSVATENVFYNYLYAVTLCSELNFSVTQAAFANSLVWAGLGIGRLTGVFASNYVTPQRIIIISIVTSILDALLMVLFGEHHAWVTWIIAFSHGFTPSVMYPSGVSWLSQITNVSGTYMFIFNIGASLGGITMLPLAGYLFDINPFSVMFQVLILAIVNAFFFGFAVHVGKRHLQYLAKKFTQKERHRSRKRKSSLKYTNCPTKMPR